MSTMNEHDVTLGLTILTDAIRLKYGRRLSHLSVIQIVDTLNSLMTKKNAAMLPSFKPETLELLASTCSYIYYFKHPSILTIF